MPQVIDMAGKTFGKLKVIKEAGINKRREMTWLCRCECGKEVILPGYTLRRGTAKSCGCGKYKYQRGENNINFKGGHYKDRLYHVWMSMKQRCCNPNNRKYPHYGGRGIKVCDEWQEYEAFRKWAYANGYDENAEYGKSTIDRIDVNGNYEPNNCRFADAKTQSNNRRIVIARRLKTA